MLSPDEILQYKEATRLVNLVNDSIEDMAIRVLDLTNQKLEEAGINQSNLGFDEWWLNHTDWAMVDGNVVNFCGENGDVHLTRDINLFLTHTPEQLAIIESARIIKKREKADQQGREAKFAKLRELEASVLKMKNELGI